MRSRYEAYMDGTALSSVHPKIIIADISHAVSTISTNSNQIANRDGLQVSSRKRANTSVTISFLLRIYDIAERQKAMQEVQRWASGRMLEVNDRPGQVLYVNCDTLPTISSAMRWNDTVTMTFVTYETPFWMEKYPVTVTMTGSSNTPSTQNVFVPGNAGKAFVEAVITPTSSLSNITLTVDATTIILSSLNASASTPITISYNDRWIQSIKKGTTSILDKRTGADDLLAECGRINSFSFTPSDAVTVVFSVRGCWL